MHRILCLTALLCLTAPLLPAQAVEPPELPVMVIAKVEQATRADLEAAVQRLLAAEPVCMGVPATNDSSVGRREKRIRIGEQRLIWLTKQPNAERVADRFVVMGLMIKHAFTGLGEGYVEYELTPLGRKSLTGKDYVFRLEFCPPAERRLVRIVSQRYLERDPDGLQPLEVKFLHVADDWPSWLPTEEVRASYDWRFAPVGVVTQGSVRLYRTWNRDEHPAKNYPHSGAIDQWCYDDVHNRRERCYIELE